MAPCRMDGWPRWLSPRRALSSYKKTCTACRPPSCRRPATSSPPLSVTSARTPSATTWSPASARSLRLSRRSSPRSPAILSSSPPTYRAAVWCSQPCLRLRLPSHAHLLQSWPVTSPRLQSRRVGRGLSAQLIGPATPTSSFARFYLALSTLTLLTLLTLTFTLNPHPHSNPHPHLYPHPQVAADIGQLSILQDGSRVVQRILPEAVSHGADFTPVLDALITKGPALANLAEDAFGNYVVQQALHHSDARRRHVLIELLLPSLAHLSTSKAGSNTAEAVLSHVPAARMAEVHRLLITEAPLDLSKHRFGRHVHSALHKRAVALNINL
mmetsp:Transcript_27842/g.56019  ORF Transcript_27842/g.56019 Transcript_27842/m.56019 type:complete len:327 (-) Transcript_27842:659-1639(-)